MKNLLITGLVALIIGAVIGVFGHNWYIQRKEVSPEEHSVAIDSLANLNRVLMDSIAFLSAQDQEAAKVVIKYKIKYDTIRPKTDLSLIVKGLNEIAETPID